MMDVSQLIKPVDKAAIADEITLKYIENGLPAPEKVVWCSSPLAMVLAYILADTRLNIKSGKPLKVMAKLEVFPVLIKNLLRRALHEESLRSNRVVADFRVKRNIAQILESHFGIDHRKATDLVESTIKGGVVNSVIPSEHNHIVSSLAQMASKIQLDNSGMCWLPYEKICWVTTRPIQLNIDEQDSFHGDGQLALEYEDNWGVAVWHGSVVPAWVTCTPAHQLLVGQIQGERNQEIRRILLQRMGWGYYLKQTRARVEQEDEYGKLYRMDAETGFPMCVVEVVNGTPEPFKGDYSVDKGFIHREDGRWYKKYFLRVPGHMKTAHQAVAWTFFQTTKTYHPLKRT